LASDELGRLEAGEPAALTGLTPVTRRSVTWRGRAFIRGGRANFHFGNGASLEKIHPAADLSEKGIAQSCGVMVNYRYDLNTVETNHELFAHRGEVVTTRAIESMLGPERPERS
jgi:hypothetical protein